MGKNNKRKRKCQAEVPNRLTPDDLHSLLVCDIDPDIRPFTWPRRPRSKNKEIVLEVGLFDFDLQGFFRDLDNYGQD